MSIVLKFKMEQRSSQTFKSCHQVIKRIQLCFCLPISYKAYLWKITRNMKTIDWSTEYREIKEKANKKPFITSDGEAVQWKILVIPLCISGARPRVVKTNERMFANSGCMITTSGLSSICPRLFVPLQDPMHSAISDTAWRRAEIKVRSHNGWDTCIVHKNN